MKKTFVFGILLVITSMTAAQTWKTRTLPFSESTDVTALLAYDNHYVAFGTNGNNLLAYYDSTNTKTISYTEGLPAELQTLTVQKAYKLKDGRSIVIGDNGLVAISKDSGMVWGINNLYGSNNQLLIENLPYFYILDINGNGYMAMSNIINGFSYFSNLTWENKPTDRLTPTCGFSGKNGVALIMPEKPSNTQINGIRSSFYSFGTLGSWNSIKTPIPSGDSVIAGLSDNETINLLATSTAGSYYLYKSDGESILEKIEITNVINGDNFISYGYIASNKIGYFIGQNKNGQAIRIGTDNSRQILNVDIIPTCLATKGDTLIIGGKDGKIIIAEKIWTSLTTQKKPVPNILVKQGGSLIITGEGNNISWRVFSSLGKIMGTGNGKEINLPLPSGMYLVEIKIDKNLVIQKTIF